MCLCVALTAVACDDSFDPIAPSDLSFSVWGYLDASADTQWIRVMPIRPLTVTSRGALVATVTLEDLGNGRIVDLRDSLFRFSPPSDQGLGAEGVYLHNFWTQERIEPGATYRFSARPEGGEPSEAVVEIPPDYEVEVAINQVGTEGATDEVWVTGLKHLPFFATAVHFYDGCGAGQSPIRFQRRSDDDEAHLITLTKQGFMARDGCGPLWVANRELWIVGSEAAWPTSGYSQTALGAAGRTSNVTNAVGFLGGALTKLLPYEDCEFQSQAAPVPQYCVLRYNRETATVSGTVREPVCFGALDSVKVQLTELDQDPARIRTVLTDEAGKFLIGALEPGIRHFMWARAPQVPIDSMFDVRTFTYQYTEWEDIHTLHTDTLTFTVGQRLAYDIDLERLTACDQPHLPRP